MNFEFATATRILFGPGRLGELPAILQGWGQRVLVVTGRSTTRASTLTQLLETQSFKPTVFSVAGEPSTADVVSGQTAARQARCQSVVAIGGGSAIDAGKAIAALLANPGDPLDYLEVVGRGQPLREVSLPLVAIPTTAGTGAEVTRNAVLSVPEKRVKVSLRSPLMLPRLAIVDPELTYGLPPAMTAATGLDALTQLIEPYVSCRANPLTDALCREGVGRVVRSLKVAWLGAVSTEGSGDAIRDDTRRARIDMSLASLFGGVALANAGLGAVHGFAGPIGGMFPAPHGAICAALLPQVMRMNIQALRRRAPHSDALLRYEQVARWLTADPRANAEDGAIWVGDLCRALSIPGLRTYGLGEDAIRAVVEKAIKASSMKGNPLPLEVGELSTILEQAR